MTKTFCDMCKEKEIIGLIPATLSFSFEKYKTYSRVSMSLPNQNLILCEECANKVVKFIIDNGLDERDVVLK